MTEVASSLPMQMTLVDVARLAKVQRPVVPFVGGHKNRVEVSRQEPI